MSDASPGTKLDCKSCSFSWNNSETLKIKIKIKIRRIPPPEPWRGLKEETDLPPPAPGKEEIAITPPKPKIGHLKEVIIGINTIITPTKNEHQKVAGTLGNFGTPPKPSMGLTKEWCVVVVNNFVKLSSKTLVTSLLLTLLLSEPGSETRNLVKKRKNKNKIVVEVP